MTKGGVPWFKIVVEKDQGGVWVWPLFAIQVSAGGKDWSSMYAWWGFLMLWGGKPNAKKGELVWKHEKQLTFRRVAWQRFGVDAGF